MKKIIAIEGIHGAGKTTQARLLEGELKDRGIAVKYFSSSDKPFSASLMKIIERRGPQDPETLFFLSLANNCALEGQLGNDTVSILDRYIHTDIASTYATGKDLEWIRSCIPLRMYPFLTLLIDLDAQEALKRKGGISSNLERGELQKGNMREGFIDYQEASRRAYLKIAQDDDRICVIDGRKCREEIHAEILKRVIEKIGI